MRHSLWLLLFSLLTFLLVILGNSIFIQSIPQKAPIQKVEKKIFNLSEQKAITKINEDLKKIVNKKLKKEHVSKPIETKPKRKKLKIVKQKTKPLTLNNHLSKELINAFNANQLKSWGIVILADGIIRISGKQAQFKKTGNSLLPSTQFSNILAELLPTYLSILNQPKYKDKIKSVLIEVHTNSLWKSAKTNEESYQQNLIYSQQQARGIERISYQIPKLAYLNQWMTLKLKATGLSFKFPIKQKNGKEDKTRSSRIEFRVDFSD